MCGPHRRCRTRSPKTTRLGCAAHGVSSNCSGKHTGMLRSRSITAADRLLCAPRASVQQRCLKSVSEYTDCRSRTSVWRLMAAA